MKTKYTTLSKNTMKANIHELNKKLKYFVVDETKSISYEEAVLSLKIALNWEIQHPDHMATCGEMQRLEHDRLIIEALWVNMAMAAAPTS